MNKQSMFNMIVLFSVLDYIEKQVEDTETYQRDFMLRILGSLRGYRVMHKFSKEEAIYITEFGKKEEFQKVKDIEVDYAIYSISLLNRWLDVTDKKNRPHLNISPVKIRRLESNLVMDMLRLKQRNTESYVKIKEIVQDSKLTAKRFIGLLEKELL